MSKFLDQAALAHPLNVADTTGAKGVYRIALTGAAQSLAVPAAWRGREVRITVDSTADVQYGFSTGAAGQTLVLDQASALTLSSAAAGASIFTLQSRNGRVPAAATFINFIASAANGFLELEMSEAY
jgi:hypothetical protein